MNQIPPTTKDRGLPLLGQRDQLKKTIFLMIIWFIIAFKFGQEIERFNYDLKGDIK